MAVKQSLIIKDEGLNEEYIIVGQSGVYSQADYKSNHEPALFDDDLSKRFVLIDLWQAGVFGSEMVKQTYDKENDINIIEEKDIDAFVQEIIDYINDNLNEVIKEHIIEEIEADEGENVILRRK